jgi:uncharacterized membrane protein YidH (DUF202 family)
MGIVCIALGLLLAKWQIYDPLHAAVQHKQRVWILSELVGAAIVLPAYGALLLLFGKRPNEWFKIDPQHLSWRNTASLLVFAGVCLAVLFFVVGTLEHQGYVVKHGW